jgi:glycosyltransferase involved in cell wall biosynthesis
MDKVLYLSYYWPPSGGPGVQRTLKFIKYLPDFEVEPFLITVKENRASYPLIDKTLKKEIPKSLKVFKTNSFEPLEWYRLLNKKKEIPYSGFVNMDKTTPFQKIARFIRGNVFIPDARVGWKSYAVKQALRLTKKESFKAIVTTSPPHSTQLAGLKLKQKTGLPWIADMRDPWTDINYYKDFYHLPFAKKKDAAFELEVLETADRILVTSFSTKKLFTEKSDKINPEKIIVIPNGYDEADFTEKSKPPKKEFVITYSGTIADSCNIDEFLNSIAEFEKLNPDFPMKINFVGKVSDGIKKQIDNLSIRKNVEYVGYVSHKKSIEYLLHSTVLFMALPQVKNNEGHIPGKLFEYLAAQKPLIFIGTRNSDVAEIIEECNAGRSFDYKDGIRMLEYINELTDKWKQSPNLDLKNKMYKKYSRKVLTKLFTEIIKGIPNSHKSESHFVSN